MEGKSYSSIRDELAESGMNDGEISSLIRQVDERVLGETVKQGDRDRAQQWYRTGLILAVIGLILSIAYNAGIILAYLPALLIYSPFFAGILVMFYGRSLRKKTIRFHWTTVQVPSGERDHLNKVCIRRAPNILHILPTFAKKLKNGRGDRKEALSLL